MTAAPGVASLTPRWRAWTRFLVGLALLLGFAFGLLPWLARLPAVRPLTEYVEESGIEATGLFYTEVEESREAEMNMRHSLEYAPVGTDSPDERISYRDSAVREPVPR